MTTNDRLKRDAARENQAHNCVCETCLYHDDYGMCHHHDVYGVPDTATCPQWKSPSEAVNMLKNLNGFPIGSNDLQEPDFDGAMGAFLQGNGWQLRISHSDNQPSKETFEQIRQMLDVLEGAQS